MELSQMVVGQLKIVNLSHVIHIINLKDLRKTMKNLNVLHYLPQVSMHMRM